jgi:hypothetical protein
VLGLFVQLFISVPQLIDLGGERIDPGQALTQQDFQPLNSALLVPERYL